ncbi:hypothetical protein GCM10010965_27430 [Caldalkalibacillus thermarum]|uniref:hypothetical protein n=1 Tax=Caldalkalibacillus thermarum TaxID=296745 RepID=UPI00166DB6CC|nr:hypothetical protein [Caldalkalibacillus thermarum]GGK33053.1 hypothetical protein GCM10010965_27430 [Caldalkalibacillus thermarum]
MNKQVVQKIRQESGGLCEYIDPDTGQRCNQPAPGEPHHIRTRGAGGEDIRENLIHLCGYHHTLIHDGNIERHHLIEVVARREGKTVDEIYDRLKLKKTENIKPINEPVSDPFLEELLAAYIQVEESEQEARWIKGQLLDEMLKKGAKQTWLSSQLGISPAQIRELVKVYRAFPKPETRMPSLSWYHHRVAANSSDPAKYIQKANDEGLSTRELRKAILEEENKEHLADTETEREMARAKRVYQQVENIIRLGGEPADWLKSRLAALFD